MKKTTFIASILIVAAIVLTLVYSESSQANSTGNYVKFHISGCDNCTVSYCIDGGQVYTVDACTFGWSDCAPGNHTICVGCPNRKSGTATFYCYGGWVQDVYVTVQSNGPTCNCAPLTK
jgi:hypothetical protein